MKKIRTLVITIVLFVSYLQISFGATNISQTNPQESVVANNVDKTDKLPIGRVKEETNLRTLNSKHFLMSDGSMQAVISSEIIHYVDEHGDLQDINTTLVDEAEIDSLTVLRSKDSASLYKKSARESNKSKDKFSASYRALQVPFDVALPKDFSDGYSIGKEQDEIKFTPVDANSVKGVLYDKNSIRYINAWDDADVELEVLSSGLKETIIANNADAPSEFVFEVKGNVNENLLSENFKIQEAWMEDALGEKRDVSTELYTIEDKTFVKLKTSYEGLSFPIKIDPTVTLNKDKVIDDAYVKSTYPTTNFNNNTLVVATNNNPDNNSEYHRSFIKFNLSSIPVGSYIKFAQLLLYINNIQGNSHPGSYAGVYKVMGDWQESSITWNNQPPLSQNPYTHLFFSNSNYPNSSFTDVTQLISELVNNPSSNFGIGLKMDNELVTVAKYGGQFSSSEYNVYPPSLYIDYNQMPGKPTLLTPSPGNSIDGSYAITWIPSVDPDDTQSSLHYQIDLSKDGGSTWNTISSQGLAGTTSFSYNFGNESETTNAMIRIRSFDGYSYSDWGVSGVFSIQHNKAPSSPSNTVPSGISSNPAAVFTTTPTLSWLFTDLDVGDSQSGFHITVYRPDNTAVFDSGWISSNLNSFTIPSNVLVRGSTYYWVVETKDKLGATSQISSKNYIKVNSLPISAFTSYLDNQSIPDNQLIFTWTYTDSDGQVQTKYQIQGSTDNWATISYNSDAILSGSSTHSATFAQGEWDFRVRVFDGYEWSDWASRNNLTLPNSFEPNDTFAEAFSIQYNQNYSTLLSSTTDIDFYQWSPTKTGIDRIALAVPVGKNYDLIVYDQNNELVVTGNRGTGKNEELLVYVTEGQKYYIKVIAPSGDNSTTPYTLNLSRFGVTSGTYQINYEYDSNGNLKNKTTISP